MTGQVFCSCGQDTHPIYPKPVTDAPSVYGLSQSFPSTAIPNQDMYLPRLLTIKGTSVARLEGESNDSITAGTELGPTVVEESLGEIEGD